MGCAVRMLVGVVSAVPVYVAFFLTDLSRRARSRCVRWRCRRGRMTAVSTRPRWTCTPAPTSWDKSRWYAVLWGEAGHAPYIVYYHVCFAVRPISSRATLLFYSWLGEERAARAYAYVHVHARTHTRTRVHTYPHALTPLQLVDWIQRRPGAGVTATTGPAVDEEPVVPLE